jgi:hypothetical protein
MGWDGMGWDGIGESLVPGKWFVVRGSWRGREGWMDGWAGRGGECRVYVFRWLVLGVGKPRVFFWDEGLGGLLLSGGISGPG